MLLVSCTHMQINAQMSTPSDDLRHDVHTTLVLFKMCGQHVNLGIRNYLAAYQQDVDSALTRVDAAGGGFRLRLVAHMCRQDQWSCDNRGASITVIKASRCLFMGKGTCGTLAMCLRLVTGSLSAGLGTAAVERQPCANKVAAGRAQLNR